MREHESVIIPTAPSTNKDEVPHPRTRTNIFLTYKNTANKPLIYPSVLH